MLKRALKKLLVRRRLKSYAEKLDRQRIPYDRWEKGREKTFFPSAENPALSVVAYTEIRDFLKEEKFRQAEDPALYLFCGEKGRLSANALSLCEDFAVRHPELSLFYGDEDELCPDGSYGSPYFKPDWSPDTWLSAFYIGSVFAARAGLLKRLDPAVIAELFPAGEDAEKGQPQERAAKPALPKLRRDPADLLFEALAALAGGFTKRKGIAFPIGHLGEILFHRDPETDLFLGRRHDGSLLSEWTFAAPSKTHPAEPAGKAPHKDPGVPSAAHSAGKNRCLISVIIPSKDHPGLLRTCLTSLYRCGDEEQPYEIIIVDNGSAPENRALTEALLRELPRDRGLREIRYLYTPMDFHFAKMCNLGAAQAKGELLLFLNDDIEAMVPGWLSGLAALAADRRRGAIGAKLLYPGGDLIQHAGITNVRLGPVHKLSRLSDGEEWYFGRNRGVHDCIGVTGACLMLTGEKFTEAGGFPEDLPVAFNDVDLCYTLFALGYDNVQDNRVWAFHHESASRGLDTEDPAKIRRMAAEYDRLMDHHPGMYHFDPYYHRYLIEDEHTSVFVFYQDALAPAGLKAMKPVQWKNISPGEEYPGAREDDCLRLGVEYAGPLEKWEQGIRRGSAASGYYIKGYAFVIGSDNACYERRLLLRKKPAGPAEEACIFEVPVEDWYRPDIELQTADQLHTALCGFKTRILKEGLEAGEYQLGMLAVDKTSRLKLVNWVPNMLIIP